MSTANHNGSCPVSGRHQDGWKERTIGTNVNPAIRADLEDPTLLLNRQCLVAKKTCGVTTWKNTPKHVSKCTDRELAGKSVSALMLAETPCMVHHQFLPQVFFQKIVQEKWHQFVLGSDERACVRPELEHVIYFGRSTCWHDQSPNGTVDEVHQSNETFHTILFWLERRFRTATLGFFQDASFSGDVEDSKPISG